MDGMQRMRELIDRLNEASRQYYDRNESMMSDDEWDSMYAELRRLEDETGERLEDSPTRRVGGEVLAGLSSTGTSQGSGAWTRPRARRRCSPGHSVPKS